MRVEKKRKPSETLRQWLRRCYPKTLGDVCELCQIVEGDIHRRHVALVECESAHKDRPDNRCGRKVCSVHFELHSDMPLCLKCLGKNVADPALVAALDAKPVKLEQPDLFSAALAA